MFFINRLEREECRDCELLRHPPYHGFVFHAVVEHWGKHFYFFSCSCYVKKNIFFAEQIEGFLTMIKRHHPKYGSGFGGYKPSDKEPDDVAKIIQNFVESWCTDHIGEGVYSQDDAESMGTKNQRKTYNF